MEYDESTGCATVVDFDGSEMTSIEHQSIENMFSWYINESTPEHLLGLPYDFSHLLVDSQQSNQTINLLASDNNNNWGTNTNNIVPFQFDQLISPSNSTGAVGNDGFEELPVAPVVVSVPAALPVPELMPISVKASSLQASDPSTSLLTGNNGPKKRRQKQLVPEDKKDSVYREKRLRNNASARKCREKAKSKSKKDMEGCINRAMSLVSQIFRRITLLKGEIKNLKGMNEKRNADYQ